MSLVTPLVMGVMAAATAAGTGVSIASAIEQGKAAKDAADYQAEEMRRQAMLAKQQSGIELAAEDQRAVQQLASIRAGAAAAGISPISGSIEHLLATNSEQAQLNDMYTQYEANARAAGITSQANLSKFSGKVAQRQSYYEAANAGISGLGSLGKIGLMYSGLPKKSKQASDFVIP